MWNFNHIYIEKEIADHPRTREILSKCSSRGIFYIDRYMDIFGRKRQDIHYQMAHRSLILAKASEELIYAGSPMCQDYGRRQFYYTSTMKNCLYDCEYCFLKGMYDCGYIVVFVNIEDILDAVEGKLAEIEEGQTMYLSVSFDTDLFSFESLTGYCAIWRRFALEHPSCELEIRTKGACQMTPESDNFITAFTLSPQEIIGRFEHGSAPLSARLDSAARLVSNGHTVRICIDPMIYVRDWKTLYGGLVDQMADALDLTRVRDFGIGTFRISKEYLKRLRVAEPDSEAVQYPFDTVDGYAGYPAGLQDEMLGFIKDSLRGYGVPEENIFLSAV
ncbi:MAG: radical SAM protein [Lachnospiraceae bacterium]|nr:radical SAM protein [Lachnospiraceae bacterium]